MRNIILIVTIILVTGCATNFKPYDDPPDKWLTSEIAIISDTQIHENKGESSRYLGKAADKAVSVTLRPAQQTIGAPEVLRRVLYDIPPDYRILHMGDALDISCVSEWELFITIMSGANREWIFIPGNHDGYLVGNFHPYSINDRYNQILRKPQWDQLCNRGRYYNIDPPPPRSLDKNSLIRRYLINLSERYPKNKIFPRKSKARLIINENRFLKCISWKIDETKPWRSYILQMVSLPSPNNPDSGYYALLFDTSNYKVQPHDAGVKGQISEEQLLDAEYFISKLSNQTKFIIGGHHPFKELNYKKMEENQKLIFERIVTDYKAIRFYISSHTHDGFWKDHIVADQVISELNIGSINDAPVYFRDLKLGFSDKDGYIIDSHIKDLHKIYRNSLCIGTSLPEDDQPHSINNQDTDDWLSAFYYLFAFWKSKHDEIEPELFVYRDLLIDFIPEHKKHELFYTWDDYSNKSKRLLNRNEILNEIDLLSDDNCDKIKCTEQRKARFIIALSEFIENNTYDIEGLHNKMACLSMMAAEEDSGNRKTKNIREQIFPERIALSSH